MTQFESTEAPFVEIDTPAFRAVAKSFSRLPFPIVFEAMRGLQSSEPMNQVDGVVKALEHALEPKDYERLLELSMNELVAVIRDWVEPIQGL